MIGFYAAGAMNGGAVVSSASWDPSAATDSIGLTNSDLRVIQGAGITTNGSVKSTKALSGKCYISGVMRGPQIFNATSGFGVCDSTYSPAAGASPFNSSVCLISGAGSLQTNGNGSSLGTLGGSSTTAEIGVEIAVDTSTRNAWIRRSGGTWIGGGDPSTGSTPSVTLGGSGPIFALAYRQNGGPNTARYVDLHPDAASTTGVVPSGFAAANWA